MEKKVDKSLLQIVILVIIIISIVFLLNKFNISDYGPGGIKEFILSKGSLGSEVYIILLALLPLVLFPDSVLVIGGGMVFGLVGGTILTIHRFTSWRYYCILISRKIGRQAVKI